MNQSFFKELPNVRVHTIQNGIDVNVFKPSFYTTVNLLKKQLNISDKKSC